EVEREVVARARRDARVREPVLGGQGGHDRLRPVSPRHGQPVGAAGDRVAHQDLQVVAGGELDRLDPPLACLVRELEALRLAAARARGVGEGGGKRRAGGAGGPRRTRTRTRRAERVAATASHSAITTAAAASGSPTTIAHTT